MEILKTQLGKALSNLWVTVLEQEGGLGDVQRSFLHLTFCGCKKRFSVFQCGKNIQDLESTVALKLVCLVK